MRSNPVGEEAEAIKRRAAAYASLDDIVLDFEPRPRRRREAVAGGRVFRVGAGGGGGAARRGHRGGHAPVRDVDVGGEDGRRGGRAHARRGGPRRHRVARSGVREDGADALDAAGHHRRRSRRRAQAAAGPDGALLLRGRVRANPRRAAARGACAPRGRNLAGGPRARRRCTRNCRPSPSPPPASGRCTRA
jgi:hypothetical protein